MEGWGPAHPEGSIVEGGCPGSSVLGDATLISISLPTWSGALPVGPGIHPVVMTLLACITRVPTLHA